MFKGVNGLLLAMCLMVPQLAVAKVYMCVDPATGKTSFTDKACASKAAGEVVRVDEANPGSRAAKPKRSGNNAWQSQRDTSLSGLDYNRARRSAQSANVAVSDR